MKQYLEQLINQDYIVVFPGRFNPFHNGHLSVYRELIKKFGANNVYIYTSDIVKKPKSPLNFEQKKYLISRIIPKDKIIKMTGSAYRIEDIVKDFNIDINTTKMIIALSEKDALRLIHSSKFKDATIPIIEMLPAKEYAYIFKIKSFMFGNVPLSASEIRNKIKNQEWDDIKDLVPYDITILQKFEKQFQEE